MNLDDIAFELRLHKDSTILDIRNALRSNYNYHCSMFFTSECQCEDEQQYYIDNDEYLIQSFNGLVSDSDKIDL